MKRRKVILYLLTVCLLFFSFSCENQGKSRLNDINIIKNEFSVHYLSVGLGDAVFINFSNGKNMLIDTGRGDRAYYRLDNILKDVDVIDYLVLSNVNENNIGNVTQVISDKRVKKVYLPFTGIKNFAFFDQVLSLIEEKSIEKVVFDYFTEIFEDCEVLFLSPKCKGTNEIYDKMSGEEILSESEYNSLSAVIYLNYNGVRFLFSSDANKEDLLGVLDCYNSGLYKIIHNNSNIDLENIDFYKVSHYGKSTNNPRDFLSLIKPVNTVISVGTNGMYCPEYDFYENLIECNENTKIYRTDADGNVSVFVDKNGNYRVSTTKG